MNGSRSTFLYLLAAAGLALTPAAQADRGNDVVARLNQLYNDTRQDCGGPSKPAFLCSGVLFRATWPSTDYMFYSISPKSQKSGGVSASYLRKDAKYRKLAYGLKSGFIFDTIFGNPKDHQDYAVLCSFPIDAATDDRAQQGCTDSRRTPNSVEKSCQDINVSTAEQWAANYRQNRGDHSRQCSFDVRDERNTAAGPAFYQSIRAMAQIADESFTTQNELRLAKWEEQFLQRAGGRPLPGQRMEGQPGQPRQQYRQHAPTTGLPLQRRPQQARVEPGTLAAVHLQRGLHRQGLQ